MNKLVCFKSVPSYVIMYVLYHFSCSTENMIKLLLYSLLFISDPSVHENKVLTGAVCSQVAPFCFSKTDWEANSSIPVSPETSFIPSFSDYRTYVLPKRILYKQ